MMIHVDDIVIMGNDAQEITDLKQYFIQHFQTKNFESL